MTVTLLEHRQNIKNNQSAYTQDLDANESLRLIKTLAIHLRNMGYKVVPSKNTLLMKDFIFTLFEAQEQSPIFNIKSSRLPVCWNRPLNWNLNYIKYEWGHLHSINQNNIAAHVVRNLGLYSARCNQHIQASMDIQELLPYGGELEQRIKLVLSKREDLFASRKWNTIESALEKLR